MIYNLTVIASVLNGRSSPDSSSGANIIFPNGFLKNDVLKANAVSVYNGVNWYGIYECYRNGVKVVLPASVVWASSGGTAYLRLDSTIPDAVEFPTEVWLSMTADGIRKKYVLVV
jgi:hypothetical protein